MERQWNNSPGEHLTVLVKLVLSENQESADPDDDNQLSGPVAQPTGWFTECLYFDHLLSTSFYHTGYSFAWKG